jgi:hypothetical protein
LKSDSIPVSGILDEASDLVRTIARPWLALLWLSTLPGMMSLVFFVDRLAVLGEKADGYGGLLYEAATLSLLAFLLTLAGRALFVRALGLAMTSRTSPGAEAFRLSPVGLVTYLYTGLSGALLFHCTAIAVLAIPFTIAFSGLAAATWDRATRPSLLEPLREIGRASRAANAVIGIQFVSGVALVVAFVNLAVLFQAGLWLLGAIPWLDTGAARALYSWDNRRFLLLVLAGAALAVEPFWLAANVVLVRKLRRLETGEDLRRWFDRIRSERPAA